MRASRQIRNTQCGSERKSNSSNCVIHPLHRSELIVPVAQSMVDLSVEWQRAFDLIGPNATRTVPTSEAPSPSSEKLLTLQARPKYKHDP